MKMKIMFLIFSSSIFLFFAGIFKKQKLILFLNWEFVNINSKVVELNFFFDFFSLFFGFSVLLISVSVMTFSFSYMHKEKFFLRFHLIVFLFIFSMLILMFSSNLIMLLVGWDGLGVVSYLLVIYFFSSKSNNAGLLTVLTNRLGDVMILISIGMYSTLASWNIWMHGLDASNFMSNSMVLILILASMTKSAQIPFSAWLPAAMAAPTPVSALVHSSTLVTAGVYLMFRFLPLMKTSIFLNFIFLSGSMTLIMAGISALYETDMKKMVALSTLSQLGLMFCSLGSGLLLSTYFHLLAHAFFKAMLFISVGNMIHLSDDYQDLRKINLSNSNSSFTFSYMMIANFSLMGTPFLTGFFSKDFVLEKMLMLFSFSWYSMLVFYLGCVLTSAYSLRFLVLTNWSYNKMSKSLIIKKDQDFQVFLSMTCLGVLAIGGGSILSWGLFQTPNEIFFPKEWKLFLIFILPLGSVLGSMLLLQNFWVQKKSIFEWSLGSMWALPFFSGNFVFLNLKKKSFFYNSLMDQTMNKKFLMQTWKNFEELSFWLSFWKDHAFFKNFFFLSILFFLTILV